MAPSSVEEGNLIKGQPFTSATRKSPPHQESLWRSPVQIASSPLLAGCSHQAPAGGASARASPPTPRSCSRGAACANDGKPALAAGSTRAPVGCRASRHPPSLPPSVLLRTPGRQQPLNLIQGVIEGGNSLGYGRVARLRAGPLVLHLPLQMAQAAIDALQPGGER